MNFSGIYKRYEHPEEDDYGSWVNDDTIYIYQDESQQLAYSFSFEEEDNYSRSYVFEEGLLYLEAGGRELHFEHLRRYEWAGGGGMGYDVSGQRSYAYRPGQMMQIFHVLDKAEIVSSGLAERIVSEKKTKMVLLDKEKDLLYERADSGKDVRRQGVWPFGHTREEFQKLWQDRVKNYVQAKLNQGMSPEEIATRCDWTVQSIQALQSQRAKPSAKKQK